MGWISKPVQLFIALAIGIAAAVFTAFMSTVAIPLFLVSERRGHDWQRLWGRGVCLIYGIRLQILFAHQVPATGGVVLAPNHQSMFDMPILCCLPANVKFVSKEEIRKVPFLGWALMAQGTVFISRRNRSRDLDVMKSVEDGLRQGKRVIVFPEGTRTRDGKLQSIKKGAFRLAQNTGCPLVPVAIQGSFYIAPPQTIPYRRGHDVTVRIGAPLRSQPGEDLSLFMDKYLKELVRLLDEGSAS